MSYEKKMKDLMARLAAMSPEPPPYPDETPMAAQSQLRRARPALVFAAAAVLVVVLAVPLLLFTGGEGPGPAATTTTTATAPSTTPTTDFTTTVPESSTTTAPTLDSWSGVVFLYQQPENSLRGGNPALVPVAVTIEDFVVFEEGIDFFQARAILAQPFEELPPGLHTAVPPEVFARNKQLNGETVVADMNEAFLDGAGGVLADFTMLNQLIYTLTDSDTQTVLFTVDGAPVEQFGSEGLDLTTPVGRGDFREHLHSINLTSPIVKSDGSYRVEGVADVFEANFNIAVLDEDGTVIHEDFATASCGTGCWGEFSIEIDSEWVVPGESSIRLFTYSAEDDSVVDAVTVPIPEGDVWQLTARD
jgi:hypothetical protein